MAKHNEITLDAMDWTTKKSDDSSEEPGIMWFVLGIFVNGVSRVFGQLLPANCCLRASNSLWNVTRSIPLVTACSRTTASLPSRRNATYTEASHSSDAKKDTCKDSSCTVNNVQGSVTGYKGVSTAPVDDSTAMSFTIPLTGSTIVATAAVVTMCSATPTCSEDVCVAMSCGGGSFTPDGAYDSLWDSVKPMKGKYTINYFQYQEDVGCVCVLNDWISSNDEICAENYNYFRFKLKGNGRSERSATAWH